MKPGSRLLGSALLTLILAARASFAQETAFTNRALKLDGNKSYLELPQNIFTGFTQATVEVWAKWAEFRTFSRVFEFGAGYHSVSLFNHMTNSDLRFNIYPRFAKAEPKWMFTATARGLLRTNEWIHLAAVSGPGGMKLYANGRLVAQHTNAMTFADIRATHTNVLGHGLAGNPTDRDFRGEIDEVRVWDHPRTVTQIRDNMFKRLAGTEDGLTHLWNFDDGTANDSGPDNHHGKLIGRARIGRALDLDLAAPAKPPPPPPVLAATNSAPTPAPIPIQVAVTAPAGTSANSTLVIVCALATLGALVIFLVLLLTRNRPARRAPAQLPEGSRPPGLPPSSASDPADHEMRARALADLTDFAKQSLVQGLYTQRAALLEANRQAQQELAALETQVASLKLPERIQAYERRIAELEGQLATRGDELRELTLATMRLLREKLDEEKQKLTGGNRLN